MNGLAGSGRSGWRRIARRVLSLHIPVGPGTKPVFRCAYRLHVAGRELLEWAVRFIWIEPIFRARCESVGPGFRMERLPYVSGAGRITIGEGVRLSGRSGIGFGSCGPGRPALCIGDGTFIGHDCGFAIASSITIGKRCLIAGRVSVRDYDGHPMDVEKRRLGLPCEADSVKRVVIGDDVWIGAGAMILKGVRIGDRSVVGAGAVVSRDVPPDCVVAGNPARIVRSLPASGAPREERCAA